MKIISLKNLLLAGILAASAGIASAQSETPARPATTRVITGMVVDKNGNPLSGAEVRATGGAETVYTEADGSFSIEVPVTLKSLTASYTGLRDCRLRTTSYNNMIFTLKDFNRTNGFVSVVGSCNFALNSTPSIDGAIPQLGLMGGAYRKWGGYLKVLMGFGGQKYVTQYYNEVEGFPHFPVISGGAIRKLNEKFNIFFGAGAGPNYNLYASPQDVAEGKANPECNWAPVVEAGVMFRYKKINAIVGLTYTTPSFDEREEPESPSHGWWDGWNDGNLSIFVGVGINI